MKKSILQLALAVLLCWLFCLPLANAYALLSHEAIIDASWESQLRPLLMKKYPGTTEAELELAHTYLYGGAVMPDIGYFPMGSGNFSDLVHYVRTGDFVHNLLTEAKDVNEYAFALGFLCHYSADCTGHPMGTNKAVPLLFPRLQRKHGADVSYEQDKKHHTRTEFSFDVFMVADGQYTPNTYHHFIGFKISRPVLERAFLKTYGIELGDIFKRFGMAESVFRFSVRSVMPALTKACWHWKKRQLNKAFKEKYRYKVDRKAYRKDFGKPGIRSMGLAFLIVALPKIGPLSILRFKVPNEEVQQLFKKSYDEVLEVYRRNIEKVSANNSDAIPNLNFDTGKATTAGEYALADEAYFALLQKLKVKNFKDMDAELRDNMLGFYSLPGQLRCPKAKSKKFKQLSKDISILKLIETK